MGDKAARKTGGPEAMNCQHCGGLLLPDNSRDSVGPVCFNCARPAYVVRPRSWRAWQPSGRPNRKIGPSPISAETVRVS